MPLLSISTEDQTAADEIISDFIEPILGELRFIQVNNELGIPVEGRTKVYFEYGQLHNILTSEDCRPPQFRSNSDRDFLTSGTDYLLDGDTGCVSFMSGVGAKYESTTGVLPVGDELKGFYQFPYFTNHELTSFLANGVNELNVRKPHSAHTLANAPLEWNPALTMYTYKMVMQRILSDTIMWRPMIIFTDPESVRARYEGLLGRAQTEWDYLAKTTKRRGSVRPKGVVTRRIATQQMVTSVNWSSFAL